MNVAEYINILDEMKETLVERYESGNMQDELLNNKIKALRYVLKFMRIIFRCFPSGFIKKIVKDDTIRNNNMSREIIETYLQNNQVEMNVENEVERIYSDEIKLMPNYKLIFQAVQKTRSRYEKISIIRFVGAVGGGIDFGGVRGRDRN